MTKLNYLKHCRDEQTMKGYKKIMWWVKKGEDGRIGRENGFDLKDAIQR